MIESANLLLDEPPLFILPQLAKLIGLNEAIILQQVHYWVRVNEKAKRNFHEGHYWTFNSYPQWQRQFPFWSLATIRRTIANLEKQGYLITGAFNKMVGDRSKWYRVNYSHMGVSTPSAQSEHPCAHSQPSTEGEVEGGDEHTPAQIDTPSAHFATPSAQNDPTITRDYLQRLPTETSTTPIGFTPSPLEAALFKLPYWKPDPEADRLWLAEFSIEYPELTLADIRACRDYHNGNRARHKGVWKNRLRNWMKINRKREEKQGDGQRIGTHKEQSTAAQRRAAVESWGE